MYNMAKFTCDTRLAAAQPADREVHSMKSPSRPRSEVRANYLAAYEGVLLAGLVRLLGVRC